MLFQFANPDYFIASSSLGSLHCLKVSSEITGETIINEERSWKKLHKSKNGDVSSCTSFGMYENDVVTVGEDGNINLLTTQRKDVVRTIGKDRVSLMINQIMISND